MENKRSLFSAIPSAIIAGIIVGMITYFGLNFGGYQEYQAQSKVVTTNIENIKDAEATSATYAATINSPKIKQKTLETLAIDWNVGKLDKKLEIKPVENSSIIDLVVTDTNKLRAEDLADQYADYTVRVINNIYNSGAKVMEYSYGSATAIDNTLTYALYAAGLGFLLWLLFDMIHINSYNKKLSKNYMKNNQREEISEVREVKERPSKKSSKKEKIEADKADSYEKNEGKKKEDEIKAYESGSTRVLDKEEIKKEASSRQNTESLKAKSETSSSKYEILGKIPSYEKGDLDV